MRYLAALVTTLLAAATSWAQANVPSPVNLYTYEQIMDAQVPMDLPFVDDEGNARTIGSIFQNKPVILVLVQYRCPMLCNQVLNGMLDAIRGLPQSVGVDFDVVVVSFDARNTGTGESKKSKLCRRLRTAAIKRRLAFSDRRQRRD